MSEKWRARGNPDYEDFNDEYEVKPPSQSHNRRDEDISSGGSSSRRHYPDEDRHRHHHKSHKKDKRKSTSPSHKRKRSRSRSRDSRNQDDFKNYDKRDRHSKDRSERSHEDRHHDSRHPNRSERYPGSHSCSVDRYRARCNAAQKLNEDRVRNCPYSNLNQPQAAVKNPITEAAKLKEEIERRKLLWSKKDKPVQSIVPPLWKKTAFTDDSDGKVSAKFKRLMGMKGGDAADPEPQSNNSLPESDVTKQNQEYLDNLEKQYEVARATTHTQRGLGLGFSSGRLWPR